MWMLKGVALGLVLFAVFFVIYFRSFAGPLVAGKALSFPLASTSACFSASKDSRITKRLLAPPLCCFQVSS